MPVMGPSYSDEQVDRLYNKVMTLLQENGIQDSPGHDLWPNWKRYRESRNARLRRAIEKLVELQSWEDF